MAVARWLWAMFGADWRSWIASTVLRKASRIILKRPLRIICGLRVTAKLDGCLAVSFTWEENHRFTDAIRSGLKERGVLPAEGTQLTVHESLRWTDQEKGLAAI